MKQRVEEMEAEAKKLREMQAAAEKSVESGASVTSGEGLETEDDRQAADERSGIGASVQGLDGVEEVSG